MRLFVLIDDEAALTGLLGAVALGESVSNKNSTSRHKGLTQGMRAFGMHRRLSSHQRASLEGDAYLRQRES